MTQKHTPTYQTMSKALKLMAGAGLLVASSLTLAQPQFLPTQSVFCHGPDFALRCVQPTGNTASITAVGQGFVNLFVVDHSTGKRLPVYARGGEYWVAGTPGAKYSVFMEKTQAQPRVLALLSVDGINAITGETATFQQSGYVLGEPRAYGIAGWRKSMQEVAAFTFATPDASYAAQTGRPSNVGVIGVALFAEKPPLPPVFVPPPPVYVPPMQAPGTYRKEASDAANAMNTMRGAPAAAPLPAPMPAPAPAPAPAPSSEQSKSARPSSNVPQGLGTQHGERQVSVTQQVSFERASANPFEILSLCYG